MQFEQLMAEAAIKKNKDKDEKKDKKDSKKTTPPTPTTEGHVQPQTETDP